MADLTGRVLKNRYRIEAYLGRGGIAEVYRAFDIRRSSHIAIKVIYADLAEDSEFLDRFAPEIERLSRLIHDNIVRFYELQREGPLAFLVMDLVEGITLRRRILEADGPLPSEEVFSISRQVCAALHYVHEEGFIHLDLKPSNIMLRPDGQVLVVDVGLAQAVDAAMHQPSMPTTPAYISPEQCRGETVDRRSDVYALGVVLYELLTGRRPFAGKVAPETVTSGVQERIRWEQMYAPPPSPRLANPVLPDGVAQVVEQALTKRREDRFSSTLALLQALEATGAGWASTAESRPAWVYPEGGQWTPALSMALPVESPPPIPPETPLVHSPPTQKPRLIILIVSGVLVVVVALTVLGVFRLGQASDLGGGFLTALLATATPTHTVTPISTHTPTITQTFTAIPTSTSTSSPTPTPTLTSRPTPTNVSLSPTARPTNTPLLPTESPTDTPELPTSTPSQAPTLTLTPPPSSTLVVSGPTVIPLVSAETIAQIGSREVIDVDINLKNAQEVYTVVKGDGIYKSSTGGDGPWAKMKIDARAVTAFVIDPTNPARFYAPTWNAVLKSSDGGNTWEAKTNGLSSANRAVDVVAVDLANANILYAGIGAALVVSTDGGDNWTSVGYGAGLVGGRLYQIVVDPFNRDIIYVGGQFGSIYKSTDSGRTFIQLAYSAGEGTFSLVAHPTQRDVYLAGINAYDAGIIKTENGGNFHSVSNGLIFGGADSAYSAITFAPSNSTIVYVGSGYEDDRFAKGIFKSTDGGESWTKINNGLSINPATGQPHYIKAMAVHPRDPNTVFAATGGGLFHSVDGGASWHLR